MLRFFSINSSRIVKCSDGSVKKGLEKCSGTNDISGFYPQNGIVVDKNRFFYPLQRIYWIKRPSDLLKKHVGNIEKIYYCLPFRCGNLAGCEQYTPYYYVGDGQRIAFVRVGDESTPATAEQMVRLVLKGSNKTYDSLHTDYKVKDYAF